MNYFYKRSTWAQKKTTKNGVQLDTVVNNAGVLTSQYAMILSPEAAKDMVLTTLFNSLSDLQAYAEDPNHLKVVEFVKPLVAERALVDYEM